MKKIYLKVLFILIIVLVTGCSEKENKTELFFFADLHTSLAEEVENTILEGVEGSTAEDYKIRFLPMYHEKIYAELAGKYGDIYFIEQGAIEGILDPVGFMPLDDIMEPGTVAEEFKDIDPDSGETHTYVIPIENNSILLRELGVTLDNPLAAFIPNFSDSKEESIELLNYLTETE